MDVSSFKCVGTSACVLVKGGNPATFDAKSTEYVIVGYEGEHGTYRLWKPGARTVIKSRDVQFFNENASTNGNSKSGQANYYVFDFKSQ